MSADNLPEYTPPAEPEKTVQSCVFFDGASNNRLGKTDAYRKNEARHKKKQDSCLLTLDVFGFSCGAAVRVEKLSSTANR